MVLIDEIDKASRDVPNNLLQVMERPRFTIAEMGHAEIVADDAFRPILILTSNSEKTLPDAFLRRCVYYHMPFPDEPTLRDIIANRIVGLPADAGLVSDAIALLGRLRERGRLRKPPGTAELLTFILTLRDNGLGPADRLGDRDDWQRWARLNLLKTKEDQEQANAHLAGIDWPPGVEG
ncbi:MAG: AAA family ATPase [Alphaproteobacteria bacterium]|nr:AAA family ATPase [Alphaproteobacteria bacterium]